MSTQQGYGFNENNAVESKLMPAGINQNIKLKKVAFENAKEDGTGIEVLRFYWESADGDIFNHTEFPIDPERTRAFAREYNNDPEEEVTKQFTQQGNRVRHILAAFLPAEKLVLSAPTWEEYCKAVVALTEDAYANELFRIKVIYNSKGFLSFPKNSISPFVENMKAPQKMRINPKYDRTTPPNDNAGQPSAADNFSQSADQAGAKPAGEAF